jgi:hypothetical protein
MKYLVLVGLLALSPLALANDCSGKMKSAQSSSAEGKVASVDVSKDSKPTETSMTPAETKKTATN